MVARQRADLGECLTRFADRLTVWPAYLTRGERGAGFAEVAAALAAARPRR